MTTLTPQSRNAVSLTNQSKNTVTLSSIVKTVVGFLLKEDTFYLLLETGGHIVIEPNTGFFATAETRH